MKTDQLSKFSQFEVSLNGVTNPESIATTDSF